MITKEDLDKMIEKNTSERYLGTGRINCYKRGAQSIAPLLLKALDGLYFECGNRCAHQNPCNAKEVITEIESMINKQGEK